jgi:hypothetical protein
MNDRPVRWVLALLVTMPLLGFSAALEAQETAALPYRVFYRQLQLMQDLGRLDKLVHNIGIESTAAGVAPTDIRLTIDDGVKTYEFKPDAQGHVELPLRADWNEADLVLHTNQPRGTLALRFGFGARPLAATRMRYRDLMDIRRQFQQAFAGLAGIMGETTPNVAGLELHFEPSSHAGVAVLAAAGRQVYPADADGVVELAEDATLWEENPEIVLDAVPKAIVPAMN